MSKYDEILKRVEELKTDVLALHKADGPRTPESFRFIANGIINGKSVLSEGDGEIRVSAITKAPLSCQRLVKTDFDKCFVGDVVYLSNAEDSTFDILSQYRVIISGKRTAYWATDGSTRVSADNYKYCYKVEM